MTTTTKMAVMVLLLVILGNAQNGWNDQRWPPEVPSSKLEFLSFPMFKLIWGWWILPQEVQMTHQSKILHFLIYFIFAYSSYYSQRCLFEGSCLLHPIHEYGDYVILALGFLLKVALQMKNNLKSFAFQTYVIPKINCCSRWFKDGFGLLFQKEDWSTSVGLYIWFFHDK